MYVFEQKLKNNVYPFKPQFYYTKVEFKGVKVIQACFRDKYMGCDLKTRKSIDGALIWLCALIMLKWYDITVFICSGLYYHKFSESM